MPEQILAGILSELSLLLHPIVRSTTSASPQEALGLAARLVEVEGSLGFPVNEELARELYKLIFDGSPEKLKTAQHLVHSRLYGSGFKPCV